MAGFAARRTYALVFQDPDLDGLVVKAKSTSVQDLLDILQLPELSKAEDTTQALGRFAACLVEWNLEDEQGQPVPATYEGCLSIDRRLMSQIIGAWTEVVSGNPGPLADTSTPGSTDPPMPMPMQAAG